MRTIIVIAAALMLSGCFGYKLVSKSELARVRKMAYLTGRMESINRAIKTGKPALAPCPEICGKGEKQ